MKDSTDAIVAYLLQYENVKYHAETHCLVVLIISRRKNLATEFIYITAHDRSKSAHDPVVPITWTDNALAVLVNS